MRDDLRRNHALYGVSLALAILTMTACSSPDKEVASRTLRDCPECPELVVIPAGSFTMGSTPAETTAARVPESRARNEHPPVAVTIGKSFAIGRNELMIGEFRSFATATGFKGTPGCFGFKDKSWALDPTATWDAPGYAVTDRHPAVCLNQADYQQYLDWLSQKTGHTYRLPTEAEWEYVAQLGTQPPRSWLAGDAEACGQFNAADRQFTTLYDENWPSFTCDDGYLITSPAGQYAANALGMYDLLGNVAELTADCFVAGHTGRPVDGSARQDEVCNARVYKGGSWAAEPGFLRPAFRVAATAEVRGLGFGLRVVREIAD
jgi:formylglycine-generating enzyme required for sulfatase activity